MTSVEIIRNPLQSALEAFSQSTGERFALHRYFPYISDLSFLTPSSDWDDESFAKNFPYSYQSLTKPDRIFPTIMVGPYGTGAHQPDECIDTEYTFGRLPELLTGLLEKLGNSLRS